MGVRARIADWPPKRDPTKDSTSTGEGLLPLPSRRRSKELELPEAGGGGWPRGLRHRSSSEVTLSEGDGGQAPPGGPGGLFREYGSTSSIDVQGLSEQSFFQMLDQFRAQTPTQRLGPAEGGAFSKAPLKNGPRGDLKEKSRRRSPKSDAESIFKKLRSGRGDGEGGKEEEAPAAPPEPGRTWLCQKSFAHYDVQSLLFDLTAVAASRAVLAQRRNTTTGASAASAPPLRGGPGASSAPDAAFSSTEDLNWKENLEHDGGDNTSNELLLSCPHFRNEIGGATERDLGFGRTPGGGGGFPGVPPSPPRPPNAGVSVLEVPREQRRDPRRLRPHGVEHLDLGARYYREHFHGREHSNYFGLDEKLGPVAVSIRRE
ncbi:SI1L3 protein, partial [Brachypteracias leptosomus]|nr:SI1L3 protein [Brachypteracias leptosomus]